MKFLLFLTACLLAFSSVDANAKVNVFLYPSPNGNPDLNPGNSYLSRTSTNAAISINPTVTIAASPAANGATCTTACRFSLLPTSPQFPVYGGFNDWITLDFFTGQIKLKANIPFSLAYVQYTVLVQDYTSGGVPKPGAANQATGVFTIYIPPPWTKVSGTFYVRGPQLVDSSITGNSNQLWNYKDGGHNVISVNTGAKSVFAATGNGGTCSAAASTLSNAGTSGSSGGAEVSSSLCVAYPTSGTKTYILSPSATDFTNTLPTGLSINPTTGFIVGTVTQSTVQTTYQVQVSATGNNANGEALDAPLIAYLTMQVDGPPIITTPFPGNTGTVADYTYVVNDVISGEVGGFVCNPACTDVSLYTNTAGTTPYILPIGLTLDGSTTGPTRSFSGSPTTTHAAVTSYLVATNAYGKAFIPLTIRIISGAPQVTGDPQFVGLHGQSFQVHGYPEQVLNIVSTPTFQLNSRFTFLAVGRPAEINSLQMRNSNQFPYTALWTHPGTYLSELGVRMFDVQQHKEYQLELIAGKYEQGIASVLLNGIAVPVNATLKFNSIQIARPSAFEVKVLTSSFEFSAVNSDMFFNLESVALPRQVIENDDLLLAAVADMDGLLGRTIDPSFHAGLATQQSVIRYVSASSKLFASDFEVSNYKYGSQ